MNNKKYHRKIMNKSNKDWTNQNNQTKVELAQNAPGIFMEPL